MNPCELVTTITALACAISKNRDSKEITLLGAAFTQLGDTLTTMAVQMDDSQT